MVKPKLGILPEKLEIYDSNINIGCSAGKSNEFICNLSNEDDLIIKDKQMKLKVNQTKLFKVE